MGDGAVMKLNPESHLILDQSLVRLPNELLRKNLKAAQLAVEKDSTFVKTTMKEVASASMSNAISAADSLSSLDVLIARVRGLKRKLTACEDEEIRLRNHLGSRTKHLSDLYAMQTFDDVKYGAWSRTRLDRLITDYCLRNGYVESAKALAKEKDIEEIVDCDTFIQMDRIRRSIKDGKVSEALSWCQDNKKELRKIDSKLEFMLRFQQYIELARTQTNSDTNRAVAHFRKYMAPMQAQYPVEVGQAGGLLISYPLHSSPSRYQALHDQYRWDFIAELFSKTHNELLNLHPRPLLHVALSAGLSALKTPACHTSTRTLSSKAAPTSAVEGTESSQVGSAMSSVCPICSTELNDLARNVPYAQHTKSHVDPDVVILPNDRVYGLSKIEEYAKKAGQPGRVRDLKTGEFFDRDEAKKVYIS